jgi:adenylate cyclase
MAPEGSVILKPDRDGVFRHYLPFGEDPKLLRPSLGLAAFAGQDQIGYESAKNLVTVANLDGRRIAFRMDAAKGVVPRYARSEGVFRRYNAAELISSAISMRAGRKPQLDPGVFDTAFVLFGYSAPGLYDRQATPLSASVPGVDIHAFFLRSLLDSSFLRRAPSWLDHALALILALASGLAFSRSRSTISRTATAICGMAAMPAAGLVAYALGYWIGIVESGLATLFALAWVLGAESLRVGRQRSFLRNAFGYYLSPRVIEKIIENPKSLSLGGERRRISVMFTDLEGFTTIAERLDPERLASLLNEYLSAMSDIIFEEGGTIDKYEGDAIIAFWNAPLEQDDHVLRAVTAALRCTERLESLRPRLADLAGPTHAGESGAGGGYSGDAAGRSFRMRIGIHTGMAVVGNMGSRSRFNYTVLGDTVNLASRLEGVNKVFGTSILVSAEVARALGFSSMRRIARVAVVGRMEAVDVYEALAPAPLAAISEDASFGAALELFENGEFGRASPIFSTLASGDPVSASYVVKCAALEAAKPEFWKGVWVLESK